MRAPRPIQERLERYARLFFFAGIVYAVAIYFAYRLGAKPLHLAAWVCYLLAAFCVFASLAGARLRIALFVIAASSGIAFLTFETVLEVRRWRDESAWLTEFAAKTGADVSRAGEHPAVARLAGGPDLPGIRCPALATHVADESLLPLGGWPLRRTLLGNELGYDAIYLADRYGFNNPDDVYDRRSGRAAVVILGDSFAQGVAVRPEANAAAALRRRGYDVLNLGCAGNGPLAELAAYREYGRHFAPDVVVWFYLETNDLGNLAGESRFLLNEYLRPDFTQNLAERNGEIVQFLDRLEVPKYRPNWPPARVATFANTWTLISAFRTSQLDLVARLRDVTSILHDAVTADGARLIVVYLPGPAAVAGETRNETCRYHGSNCKAQVLKVFEERSIPVLDYEAVLARLDDPLGVFTFRIGQAARGHYTEAGYALLGNSIADELDKTPHSRGAIP